MGMLKNRGFLLSVVLFLALIVGCGAADEPNLLLGEWKVFHVDRGGMIITGPQFKGTSFTFRENGTVFAQGQGGDTLTSRYLRNLDTLTYVGIATYVEETYLIDTLTIDRLKISANIDGIPTVITMKKIKK